MRAQLDHNSVADLSLFFEKTAWILHFIILTILRIYKSSKSRASSDSILRPEFDVFFLRLLIFRLRFEFNLSVLGGFTKNKLFFEFCSFSQFTECSITTINGVPHSHPESFFLSEIVSVIFSFFQKEWIKLIFKFLILQLHIVFHQYLFFRLDRNVQLL